MRQGGQPTLVGMVGNSTAGQGGPGRPGGKADGPILCFQEPGAGVSVSAIERKLAGLALLLKLQGCGDFTKDFWVRQALKGYRRSHGHKDAQRPVSFANLQAIFTQLLCITAYEVSLFKAAFSLAFFGAFRIGELVSSSKRVQGGILAQDVVCRENSVQLLLRRSKTDQLGKDAQVQLFSLPGSPVCPVGAVSEFFGGSPSFGWVIFVAC